MISGDVFENLFIAKNTKIINAKTKYSLINETTFLIAFYICK
jgi:hypothetical protein